jgi:hypothetical protein
VDHGETRLGGEPEPGRAGQTEHRQRAVVVGDRADDGGSLRLVMADRVVEGAVRLHVTDTVPGDPGERVESAELVDDLVAQRGRLDVDEAAAEAGLVRIPDVSADGDTALDRLAGHPAHDRGVAGVEAACHVGAGDDVEQRTVVAHRPGAESLTEVCVEVHTSC